VSRFRPRLSGKNPATERRGRPTNERERIHRLGSRPRGGGGGARARALAATRGDCRGETRGDASPRRRGVVDARPRARGRKSGQHSSGWSGRDTVGRGSGPGGCRETRRGVGGTRPQTHPHVALRLRHRARVTWRVETRAIVCVHARGARRNPRHR
jgi:hypothetical protein